MLLTGGSNPIDRHTLHGGVGRNRIDHSNLARIARLPWYMLPHCVVSPTVASVELNALTLTLRGEYRSRTDRLFGASEVLFQMS